MSGKRTESIFEAKKRISFKGGKDLSQRIDEVVYDDIDEQVKSRKMKTVSEKELRKNPKLI